VTCPPARARALGETSDSGAACPFGFDGKFKEESTSRDDRDGGRDMKGISSVAGPFSLLLAVSLTMGIVNESISPEQCYRIELDRTFRNEPG